MSLFVFLLSPLQGLHWQKQHPDDFQLFSSFALNMGKTAFTLRCVSREKGSQGPALGQSLALTAFLRNSHRVTRHP